MTELTRERVREIAAQDPEIATPDPSFGLQSFRFTCSNERIALAKRVVALEEEVETLSTADHFWNVDSESGGCTLHEIASESDCDHGDVVEVSQARSLPDVWMVVERDGDDEISELHTFSTEAEALACRAIIAARNEKEAGS